MGYLWIFTISSGDSPDFWTINSSSSRMVAPPQPSNTEPRRPPPMCSTWAMLTWIRPMGRADSRSTDAIWKDFRKWWTPFMDPKSGWFVPWIFAANFRLFFVFWRFIWFDPEVWMMISMTFLIFFVSWFCCHANSFQGPTPTKRRIQHAFSSNFQGTSPYRTWNRKVIFLNKWKGICYDVMTC